MRTEMKAGREVDQQGAVTGQQKLRNQQKDAQRQRGNLLRLRREVLYRFQGSDDKCETMGV